jgi:hypothetical protein
MLPGVIVFDVRRDRYNPQPVSRRSRVDILQLADKSGLLNSGDSMTKGDVAEQHPPGSQSSMNPSTLVRSAHRLDELAGDFAANALMNIVALSPVVQLFHGRLAVEKQLMQLLDVAGLVTIDLVEDLIVR